MAPLLEDPRIRQTWNQFSQNAESATESAAAGIWTFQHRYITPCLASLSSSISSCTAQCFPENQRPARNTRRARAELSFDFYDDWEQDETAWGNDELDRLLAGSGEPRRKKGMSYGTSGPRRRSSPDPTVIPSTSKLGFLGRLPFKLGGTLRYKPSAADLQEHPGALRGEFRGEGEEGEPLIADEEDEDEEGAFVKGHARQRSSTVSSGETSDSFRSRGDLFPSDGEDDAVPLSDEFAMVLERRTTGSNTDDKSSGKTRSSKGKRPARSRTASKNIERATISSQTRPTLSGHRASSGASIPQSQTPDFSSPEVTSIPSLTDLQAEEERVRFEEDAEVERKREAAARLATERGLVVEESKEEVQVEDIRPPDAKEGPAAESESGEFVPARLPHFG
ncbi:hypothetical protein LSUE1_G008578 [Lachnellula suecica]|uniref:Uncharacterized protein n=1 Tax=Lachnellula suecica TaxID=602035 RepID=A0A8T9BU45_9HELO|nr:hypothetical protein LSUE1_G008578 [Lachnellula suecica]